MGCLTLILEDNDKEQKDFLLDLIQTNHCVVSCTIWKSKYNSYVVYDYEPFCSEGFNIQVDIEGAYENLQFIQYVYEKRIKNIKLLEKCFKLTAKKNKKKEELIYGEYN